MFLILLLGPPGSGKGSLSQVLQQKYGFVHFSTGRIFRALKDENTSKGSLVSDDLVNELVVKELEKIRSQNEHARIVLDGYPRTNVQAMFLQKRYSLSKVFILTGVSKEFILQRLNNRLLCKKEDHSFNLVTNPPKVHGICDFDGSELYRRNDDSGEVIQKRLNVYEQFTKPLIDYYTEQNLIVEIDAFATIDKMVASIVKHIL